MNELAHSDGTRRDQDVYNLPYGATISYQGCEIVIPSDTLSGPSVSEVRAVYRWSSGVDLTPDRSAVPVFLKELRGGLERF